MEARNDYYYGIDIVRFLSALWVAFYHLGFSTWANPRSGGLRISEGSYTSPELASIGWFGLLGVEIFFIISGFVIANSAANATPISFAKGRALRLYPAVWICATCTAVFLLFEGQQVFGRYLASLFLFPPTGPFIDGQYWTLGVEMVFYAFVFGLLAIGRFRYLLAFAAILVTVSSSAILATLLVPELIFLGQGAWRLTLLYHGVYFGWGIFLFFAATGRWRGWMTGASLASAAIVVTHMCRKAVLVLEGASAAPPTLMSQWYWMPLAFAIGVGMIIASIRYRQVLAALPDPIRRTIRNLGLTTYPLYLLHFALGVGMVRELAQVGVPGWLAVLTSIALLVLAAMWVAVVLEGRIRRHFRSVLDYIDERLIQPNRRLTALYRTDNHSDAASSRLKAPLSVSPG